MSSYIYNIFDKAKFQELLQAFETCMRLSIQVLDEEGNILEAAGSKCAYCQHFVSCLSDKDECRKLHAKASQRALTLGETYIFSCHSNLNHMVFPLISKEVLYGSILVGPFLMDKPDSLLILDVGKRYPSLTKENLLELYDDANMIRIIPPATVTQISKLLYYLFFNFVSDSREQLIANQNKLHQQAKISESIQMYKTLEAPPSETYPMEKEQQLLAKVKLGNIQEARSILNDLLGYVFFAEGNSLEVVKSRAVELCSLLSRSVIECGAATDQILRINNQFLKKLQSIRTLENLCYTLEEVLNTYIECIFPSMTTKNGENARKAMRYISQHFASKLTLEEVAEFVHLNPAYFSTLFKQTVGSSFKEYVTMVRIEESKRLLANTDYALIDIAVATGFEDQSYFSKVFKQYTGLTPKQYRSQ